MLETQSPPETGIADRLLKFAAHVRDTPSALGESADSLARMFELPVDIVRESLDVARTGKGKSARREGLGLAGHIALAWRSFIGGVRRHPILAASLVSAVFFGTYKYVQAYAAASQDIFGIVSLLIGLFLLSAINFVRGQVRFALYTGITAVAVGAAVAASIDVVIGKKIVTAAVMQETLFRAIIFVILLTAFFSIGAIFGALAHIRRQAIDEQGQDRLQLLQRVFNLQETLAGTTSTAREEMRLRSWLLAARSNWIWVAVACGAFIGMLTLIQLLLFGDVGRNPSVVEQSYFLLILLLLMAMFPAIGFVAGNWLKGLAGGLLAYAVSFSVWFLPIDGLGWAQLEATFKQNPASFVNGAILIFMAIVGGVGASIDNRLQHSRRLDSADQSAVLKEIIRIQQLLQTGSAEVCVMAVDCVKSTRMKNEADPLAIEISFREFHEFLSREVIRHGGTVHSIAGDGAVAEFASIENAFQSARHIQTLIPEFNRRSNKLATPFKVRIGLHCGSVHGGLEQVVFASVIDIAAHIQKEATVGGIIVSERVRESLDPAEFLPVAEPVDGVNLFLCKNPTLD